MSRTSVLILMLLVFAIPLRERCISSEICNYVDLEKQWTGKYPSDRGVNFVKLPEVRENIEQLVGKKYANRLANLDKKPLYLFVPIKNIHQNLILDFLPNSHVNAEDTRILIFINLKDCSMHACFISDMGRVIWRHLGNNDVPSVLLREYGLKQPR